MHPENPPYCGGVACCSQRWLFHSHHDCDLYATNDGDSFFVPGTGIFAVGQDLSTIAYGAAQVFLADLNADGAMDVVAGTSASYDDDTITWYENEAGSFSLGTDLALAVRSCLLERQYGGKSQLFMRKKLCPVVAFALQSSAYKDDMTSRLEDSPSPVPHSRPPACCVKRTSSGEFEFSWMCHLSFGVK